MKILTGTYSLVNMSKPQQADGEVLITFLKLFHKIVSIV